MLLSGYRCNGCSVTKIFEGGADDFLPNKIALISSARKEGWSIGKIVLCPKCKANRERVA